MNEALADTPEALNTDPYGAWIAKLDTVSAQSPLMDAGAYEAFVQEG